MDKNSEIVKKCWEMCENWANEKKTMMSLKIDQKSWKISNNNGKIGKSWIKIGQKSRKDVK